MIPRLVVATKNPDKRAEVMAVLGRLGLVEEVVEDATWPDVDETGETLVANARLKARAAATATGLPALADDTGLEVDALGGRPGVHTARFGGDDATYEENVVALLAALDGLKERAARFRTVMVLVAGDAEVVAEGSLHGVIADAPRGSNGFGYDPVFQVGASTLAEMDEETKNRISHRALALRHLAQLLQDKPLASPGSPKTTV